VVLPHLTESYASSTDPSTPQLPVCSIRSNPTQVFPLLLTPSPLDDLYPLSQPEHFVAWAKELFQTHLYINPRLVQQQQQQQQLLLSSSLSSSPAPSALVKEYLALTSRPAAVRWATTLFQRCFPTDSEGQQGELDLQLKEQFISSAAEIVLGIMNSSSSSIPPFDKVPSLSLFASSLASPSLPLRMTSLPVDM
jgi:hypothetical protein